MYFVKLWDKGDDKWEAEEREAQGISKLWEGQAFHDLLRSSTPQCMHMPSSRHGVTSETLSLQAFQLG